MNKDQTSGTFDQIKGETKEGFGRLTNNESLEAEGKMDQFVGNVKEKFGDVKEKVAEEFNEHTDRDRNKY